MLTRFLIIAFVICLSAHFAQSQENKILLTFNDNTSKLIKKGDYVRLSYPSAKLAIKKTAKTPALLGFRGKVDSIAINQVWLKVDKRIDKKLAFTLADVVAIKRVSKSAEFLTFLGSWAVIGGGAALVANAADLNSGAVAFAGIFSLFPAAIVTANVFYSTKPKNKVGEGYTIKVITIN